MTIRYLAVGVALAALLSACGQKQSSTASAPDAPAATTQAESAAPAAQPTPAPAASAPSTQASASAPARFEAKSGRVEFTLSGMQSGTETMTWDDYGARTVTETKAAVSMGNLPARSHDTRVIFTGDSMIVLNLDGKTAMKMDHVLEQAKAMTGAQDMRVYSQEMMAKMGASKTGSEAIAGKTCDVWTVTQMGMSVCVWKGVALKSDASMMGVKMSKLATKIDENVAVDPTLFEIPAGFTTTDAPAMSSGAMPGMPGMAPGAMPQGMGAGMMGAAGGDAGTDAAPKTPEPSSGN